MHPAPSVIAFTTLSGAGFGMLVWLGLALPLVTGWAAFGYFTVAYVLCVGGLLASTFHLGHPERAHLAFTQWRSSWLSREACAAVAALTVMGAYGAGAVFLGAQWAILGWLGAALSLVTVFTTAMIYAQLRTVPRWRQPATPALFLALSLTGGAILTGNIAAALPLLLLSGGLQIAHWALGDRQFARSGSTMETATALGPIGRVRAFAPPHTGRNYLTDEMVFRIGRKHARRLRGLALAMGCLAPAVLLALDPGVVLLPVAAGLHLAGTAASRWLFFAEAEHTVGLYYGR